jgi:hypothetical protein
VLAFAEHATTSGFNAHTIGYILPVVGVIGALLPLMFWSSWGGVGRRRRGRSALREDDLEAVAACEDEITAVGAGICPCDRQS